MKNQHSIWITWENQIRNISMSQRLNAKYTPIISSKGRLMRYIYCSIKTIVCLVKNRDKTIYVQNPSVVLSLIAIMFKLAFGTRVIVDAHNSGVYPASWLQSICNFINKHADYVIVTNDGLASFVEQLGGRPIVLPDPVPLLERSSLCTIRVCSPSVFFISSWAIDEPIVEMVKVARSMPNVNFYMSGKPKQHLLNQIGEIPSNLHLTGYVSHEMYIEYMTFCDVLVDLTTNEDCLVCGAYEAIALKKPIILSDTDALRFYFGNYALFTNNNAIDMESTIKAFFMNADQITNKCINESLVFDGKWKELLDRSPISIAL